jgi:uncharacterized protein
MFFHIVGFLIALLLTPAAAVAQDAGPYQSLSCERRIEFWVTEVGLPTTRASNDLVAAPYLDRECKAGLEGSCPCSRGLTALGKTPEAGEAIVRQELEPLCRDGDGWACMRLSRLTGWYTNDDALNRKSLEEMERGCTSGFPAACSSAGVMLVKLSKSPDEYRRGVDLMVRACDMAAFDQTPCAMALLASIEPTRPDVKPDYSRLADLAGRICERGDAEFCSLAGRVFENGEYTAVDLARSRAMRSRGCELGRIDACTDYGRMLYHGEGGPSDRDGAANPVRIGCEGGDMHACAILGGMHFYGHGVPKDRARAFRLAATACDGGNFFGCSNATAALLLGEGVGRNTEVALKYSLKGCALGYAKACADVGLAYTQGRGAPKNLALAEDFYERATSIDPDAPDARKGLQQVRNLRLAAK